MNSPYKVSLTKLYNKLHLESYDITLVQFIKFAEKQGYKPWKELSLYDKDKGYNLDNMYFSYNTQPSLAQCGFKLDGTPRKVMRDSERVNQLKMIGAVNHRIDTVVDELSSMLQMFEGGFTQEALDRFHGILAEYRRCASKCDDFLDEAEIIKGFIHPTDEQQDSE